MIIMETQTNFVIGKVRSLWRRGRLSSGATKITKFNAEEEG
jgi:hypothetical protein